ncbi:hypothetical protein [Bradyrhizobium shewense]|uniref:hypothetical protein n=1 Tax=Bradyrhizobium shewense TaxID=1761772 RepID=UPI000B85D058|nr:hypothetical protein [Bradyrhizobium shewense]
MSPIEQATIGGDDATAGVRSSGFVVARAALCRGPFAPSALTRRLNGTLGGDASAQRVHEVDDVLA